MIWAARINEYASRYAALGFRAGASYHNPEWCDAFSFSYVISVPNVALLDAQRGACCTISLFHQGSFRASPDYHEGLFSVSPPLGLFDRALEASVDDDSGAAWAG